MSIAAVVCMDRWTVSPPRQRSGPPRQRRESLRTQSKAPFPRVAASVQSVYLAPPGTGVPGHGREVGAAWPVASRQLNAARHVRQRRLQQCPPPSPPGTSRQPSAKSGVAKMQHRSSTTETATTGIQPVTALILRSGITQPGMIAYVMDSLKEAMQYVMECSPDRKDEVLKHFVKVMKPDAIDTASESASRDSMMYGGQLQRAVRTCFTFVRIVDRGYGGKLSASPQTFPRRACSRVRLRQSTAAAKTLTTFHGPSLTA